MRLEALGKSNHGTGSVAKAENIVQIGTITNTHPHTNTHQGPGPRNTFQNPGHQRQSKLTKQDGTSVSQADTTLRQRVRYPSLEECLRSGINPTVHIKKSCST